MLAAAVCRQHTDQRFPTEMMCLGSIRGEQPIKTMQRFIPQVKLLQVRAKWATAWSGKDTHSSRSVLATLLSTAMHMLYGQVKVKRWSCGGRVGTVDVGEQGVDSRLPLHLPCPRTIVHHHVYLQREWDADSCWQKLSWPKGGRDRKRGGPKMALNEWKSSLPILTIKLKRQQAQTRESECDRFVEFSMAETGSNQTGTYPSAWLQNKIYMYGAGDIPREWMTVCWYRGTFHFLNQLQNKC